jgi:hypothetical protein
MVDIGSRAVYIEIRFLLSTGSIYPSPVRRKSAAQSLRSGCVGSDLKIVDIIKYSSSL